MRRGGVESSKQIALTLDDLRQLDMYFESQWRRPPTPEEFGRLVENKVQEEVLYREALAMGLDKDDTIVKRRMAQKMQFLAEDVAAAHEPTTDELKAWFEKNSEKFALPSRVTSVISTSPPTGVASARVTTRWRRWRSSPANPRTRSSPTSLADPFMFQDYYGDRALGTARQGVRTAVRSGGVSTAAGIVAGSD